MERTPSSRSPRSADQVFAAWLARRVAFEDVLAAHPEHAQALRELHAHWLRVEPLLRLAGLDDAGFAERLSAVHGEGLDPAITLDPPEGSGASALLERLGRKTTNSRYRPDGEIARGGMGAILRVWDEDIRRHLAMKVILPQRDAPATGPAATPDPARLSRFLEEAQITGQLDHPGIAPVHELGIDADGRVFFTMKLVRGRDLRTIFDLVFEGQEGWNETRALSVLLKVCEAVAYAHKKGVIHRDIKPANVMVGDFGEVYVMDWGLARVAGRTDRHDMRIAPDPAASRSIRTDRRDEREDSPDSPIVTMDGDVVGTPAYMPLEQAQGRVELLTARSDVYAIGAMLYHLLARQMPYVAPGVRLSNRMLLLWLLDRPPRPLATIRPGIPLELVAICEKAMARDPADRYTDTLALAEDLRAYLERRVVRAHATGAWAEARKWVERNKPLAAALAAAVALLCAGLTASLVFKGRADDQARIAMQKANDVLSLSAVHDLTELEREAALLWPPEPAMIPRYDAWLARARMLVDGVPADPRRGIEPRFGLADHEAKLAQVRLRGRRAEPASASSPHAPDRNDSPPGAWEFADSRDSWWNDQLAGLVARIEDFADPRTGLLGSGVSPDHGWGVAKRREFAATIEERSVSGAEPARRWARAIEAVRDEPRYDGLVLAPQLGLLPIGPDPQSGLWEFAHLMSGDPPERGQDGELVRAAGMGVVLVLIPGDTFSMGAQREDPAGPNFDADANANESPVDEVALAPFLLSKFEMTQAQWRTLTGGTPSLYREEEYSVAWNRAGNPASDLHPVERVSWDDCARTCARSGLALPTEAQWEFACRAGSSTPFWSGSADGTLAAVANLADEFAMRHGGSNWQTESWDDGNSVHAPVGSYAANPFGLHDPHGNVWEWCADWLGDYSIPPRAGDGLRPVETPRFRACRGGSFGSLANSARSSTRWYGDPASALDFVGLRPSRPLVEPSRER